MTADRLVDVTLNVTIPCPKCGQRVYEWALPTRCSGCQTALLRPDHTRLEPMASSFVVEVAYRALLTEFDGPVPGETVWTCAHDHSTVDSAVACAKQHRAHLKRDCE